MLSTIQTLEHQLRSIVAYRIAEKYGSSQSDYLRITNYNLGKPYRNGYEINAFEKFNRILNDDIHPFKHYRDAYNNCPPWILLKGK